MPVDKMIKKVLVIGSGPIVIGQAAEFDYSGAQACRVLGEQGIETVLVNSNPATIMTDKSMANEVYLEPLRPETIERIIIKEKPDSLLAGLGGQTALTLAMQLSESGFLKRHNVKLIGTNVEAIEKAEDRQLFKDAMDELGQPTIPSETAQTVESCVEIANKIGYPVIVRPAFTLGGAGGGVAFDEATLVNTASGGIALSPIHQVLIEKYIAGRKEIEFEVMRDSVGNAVTICSMENIDPVGIHTGDSFVVAPAMTLSSHEFDMLRNAALDICCALNIVGGCNCQFALDPETDEYAVIEVNPRVSRSSALASKATGYPIAKVTAKIALGCTLDEITNDVTGKTCACFEPTLDYVALKIPKWPFDKFNKASRKLGPQMKATGEAMAIGQSVEEALMKAVRGAEINMLTLNTPLLDGTDPVERLKIKDDLRIFAVFRALKHGVSPKVINDITKIDLFFIDKINNLVKYENDIASLPLTDELYLRGKKLGYPDEAIESISGQKIKRKRLPVYKTVDTCAGEFSAETPYFYSCYDDFCEARDVIDSEKGRKERIIVLGSGPIRIGQGIEFDYSSVHCAQTLRKMGYEVIIINNNPETVSTDFDVSDRLYFEPLTKEDVWGVIKAENPIGVVVAFGGQTAVKLAKFLDESGVKILGTSAKGIDTAEDREQFDALLNRFGIKRPRGIGVMTKKEALKAANTIGYPVLLRPSYVIGGQNMTIARSDADTDAYMDIITAQGIENPVLIDKYMSGTELEVDVISDGEDVLIPGIMEHVERAGVHSGDSIAIYPPQNISDKLIKTIEDSSFKLAKSLGTRGLVNIQYLISDNELYVIEVNPRASRTVPYISKVTGLPLVDIATKVMLGAKLKDLGYTSGLYKAPPYVAVKVPVFSFEKLSDVNSALGPEMKSTGEVLGIGRTFTEALYKGMVSAGFTVGRDNRGRNGVFITVSDSDKYEIVTLAKKLDDLGMKIYATRSTAKAISALGIDVTVVKKLSENNDELNLLNDDKLALIVYTGAASASAYDDYITLHRRALLKSVACVTSLDTANALADISLSGFSLYNTELVDIAALRTKRQSVPFVKMHAEGNDYICLDNRNGEITNPESMAITMCDRHRGIGGDGIVLLEKSDIADAGMRIFNRDGSEGNTAGNAIRCVAKYLYDNGIVKTENMTIETFSGVKKVFVFTYSGSVRSVSVDIGRVSYKPADVPVLLDGDSAINRAVTVGNEEYNVNCISVGSPHCVIFCDRVDSINLSKVGPSFENSPLFPKRVNTEFVRVVNSKTLKMRVWERGSGETLSCGTGACAAVCAAVENGSCQAGTDITVKSAGGDLIVNYTPEKTVLTGEATLVFEGTVIC